MGGLGDLSSLNGHGILGDLGGLGDMDYLCGLCGLGDIGGVGGLVFQLVFVI